uniref:uncharacterized protein At5g23160 n=1 Tax=Erigeron canadensis TaxID=72917 RepID=UPI001CB98728|nr:uncharacterized protein At5g23160 [Erigeron canadensis]
MIKKPDSGPPSRSARTGCFLACFGCTGLQDQYIKPKEKVNSPKWRRPRWISKFTLISFKKPVVKDVVPVDPKRPVNKSGNKTWEIQVVEEEDVATKWTDSVRQRNGSYRSRKKETKVVTRLPAEKKHGAVVSKAIVSTPSKPLTHSVSLPIPTKEKKLADGPKVVKKTIPLGGKYDSIIGMSVILVILVIMVLWGKLCAILCTSTWFYIIPRLGAAGRYSVVDTIKKRRPESHENLDMESVEYKKKVVLEGLLQRNNRNVVGRSTR